MSDESKNWAIWHCMRHGRLFAAHAGCSLCRTDPDPSSSGSTPVQADKYARAIEFLRDIADLAGTTKRKQAGCEIAAHALAQLREPRSP